MTPKPYQKPWPEIRVAANSADTFPAIAKLGHAVFVAVRLGTLEELEPNITAYREGLEGSRASRRGQGVPARPGLCRRDRRGGAARSRKKASCISTAISASGSRIRRPAPGCARSRTAPRAAAGCRTITYEDALREKIIVGSPERVTDRLMGLKETLGLDGILCEMNCGTKIPHERVMKSLQLLCEKVSPRFN